ncbi:modification methylase [Gracilibacillus phocaeensis]|uniref:modification methylase n=1 Tax=Gracilibacillus phocaeensis TaxID=2042304 RepID=UPI00102F4912|nr:modification methylase [Gracilibacillus phocaeensis]
MSIKEKLEEKSIGYWDFSSSKSSGIHKISSYPATMVPDMQKELIKTIMEEDRSVKNMLDPFHGSGVTLVEGASLGLIPKGFDINPMAHLITKVKLQGVNKKRVIISNKRIKNIISNENHQYEIHNFNKINKWFRKDMIATLSKIRSAIQTEKYKHIRQYYWVCLINIIKKYSNTRSSTFKLHIKEDHEINAFKNNAINDFFHNIDINYMYLPEYSESSEFKLSIGNTRELLTHELRENVDFICTSPPYGDNATTVTYGQYSMLPLYWIDKQDIGRFDNSLLDNYSSIDSASLGGSKSGTSKFNFESTILNQYLIHINLNKQKKINKFITDYLVILNQMKEVLKPNKYMIFTLGNRRVDNHILPLTEITKEFLLEHNFILEIELSRNIPLKKMPRKVSNVNNQSVNSMNTEYILIFKKERN